MPLTSAQGQESNTLAGKVGFDILSHVLVPKHRIMTEKEVADLLAKYHISKIQLPEITSSDSVVEAIGAKEGDVLEIFRKGVSGQEVYYRRVVK